MLVTRLAKNLLSLDFELPAIHFTKAKPARPEGPSERSQNCKIVMSQNCQFKCQIITGQNCQTKLGKNVK